MGSPPSFFVFSCSGGSFANITQLGKSNCRVDEIAKDNLPGFHIAGKEVFDALAEKRLAKARVALNARPDGFFEISCQIHGITFLFLFVTCSPATG